MTSSEVQIVNYPHPTLRHVSQPVRHVDAELRKLVGRMFELMYEAQGVGLAANQVDLPVRLFVVNVAGNPDEGEERVFINPVIHNPKGSEEREEGCLSLPGVYGQIKRPERVKVEAYDLSGREVKLELDGLLGRVVQHELDHLDGVLFTDRLSTTGKLAVREALEAFEAEFHRRRVRGEFPSDADIAARLQQLEQQYCGTSPTRVAAARW